MDSLFEKHLPFVIFCDQNTKYIRYKNNVWRRTELLKMREIIEQRIVASTQKEQSMFRSAPKELIFMAGYDI